MRHWIACVSVLIACGKGSESTQPGPVSGSGSAVTSVGQDAIPAVDAPSAPAVAPKIAAARCDEPCLFLLDTPIDQLAETYKAKCAGKETKRLGFADCKQLDYVRNCIYAAHGVVYKKNKWKKLFAAKPWYEPHADVVAGKLAMSEVEHANVHELYMRGKACKKGMSISGADYERLKAWFAKLPGTPPMPKLVFRAETNEVGGDPEAISGKDFVGWLASRDAQLAKQFARGKDTVVSYEDSDTLAEQHKLLELMHVTDPHSLRTILVEVELAHGTEEQPGSEDLTLRFIYDSHDQLFAIAGDHSSVWD